MRCSTVHCAIATEMALYGEANYRRFPTLIPHRSRLLAILKTSGSRRSLCTYVFINVSTLVRFMGAERTEDRHPFTGLPFSFLFISFILSSFFIPVFFPSLPLFIFRLLFSSFFPSCLSLLFVPYFFPCLSVSDGRTV